MNMTFGSEGLTIIELNDCKSRATTYVYSEFSQLKSSSSEVYQRRRSKNNIMEFYHYGPVYVSIQSEKTIVRWFAINRASGAGQGYDDYQVSRMHVMKTGRKIKVKAEPILPVNKQRVKSKIQMVNYTFVAAQEKLELYEAMNCGEGEFVKKIVRHNSTFSDKVVKVSFDVKI
jgi:hypothetical protein